MSTPQYAEHPCATSFEVNRFAGENELGWVGVFGVACYCGCTPGRQRAGGGLVAVLAVRRELESEGVAVGLRAPRLSDRRRSKQRVAVFFGGSQHQAPVK